MKFERYKENVFRWGINLSVLLIFWGGMLRKSFNADTLGHMFSKDADIYWRIADGRYMIALLDAILLKVGIRTTTNLNVAMLFTFFFLAATMMVIQKIFISWRPENFWERIGYFCGEALVFLNTLFAEVLMFGEMSVYFALGYLLAAMGVERFTRKKYISMFILFAAAVCTYQFTMVFAAVMIAFYVCLKHKEELTLRAVLEEIAGIVSCIGFGVLNYVSIMALENFGIIERFNKSAGLGDIARKIAALGKNILSLYESGMGIMPGVWLPLLFVLGLFMLIVYSCIKAETVKKIPFIVIVFLGSTILIYGIPMMEEEFYFPPRMAFCFYLIQGMLIVLTYAISAVQLRRLLTYGCMGYLLLQLLFSNFVVTDHIVSNTLDEVYADMVYQEILKYEEETGNVITKLAIYKDASAPDYYEEVDFHVDQINEKVLGIVSKSLIWKVTGREFEKTEPVDEVYNQYFRGKDWDYFDLSQQMVIIGNTVHWCIF